MTSPTLGSVFVVDDEVELMMALCEALTAQGYDATGFVSAPEALEALHAQNVDVLLCDLMMPDMDGIALLRAALDIDPHLVGLIMTGQGTIQTAVEAMQIGAFDYVLKPFKLQALLPVLARAQQVRRLRLENLQLRETVAIYELGQAIAYTLDTRAILDKVVDGAVQQVDADEASIMLPMADSHALFVAAVRGQERDTLLGERVSLEQSLAGWVARHHQPLTLHGAVSDPHVALLPPRPDFTAVALPMLAGGDLTGVLNVSAKHRRRPFTLGQVKALSILANLAAAALVNASLYAQVRQSEERFRSVAESATDAIILADSSETILSWTTSAQALFGYNRDEIVGQPFTRLIPERYTHACADGMRRVIATGQQHLAGQVVELYGLTKDGREFPAELSLASWQTTSGTFFGAIIRDLSERKRAEKELQRQREAAYQAEKLATMGQLLAGVAHELNNPLTVVQGQAHLLQQEVSDGPLAARVQEITRATERCVRIVRNFLALARQHHMERSPTHLNQVIEEAVDLLAYQLRVDAVEVQVYLDDDLPPLWADADQIYQVVVNLVSNAHQAMRETPALRRLTLTTRYDPVGNRVALEVADTGPGIPPEIQAHIFEPFFTTKPQGVGTGLGLSLCQGIIEEHEGSIGVDSQPGHGTVFRIELPVVAPPETVPAPPTAEPHAALQGKTILVVDDEPQIADVLAQALSIDDHHVEIATNGNSALNKLQERAYDLILSDLRMPTLDGPTFYRELVHQDPTYQQRFIFLTGDTLSPETRAFLDHTRVPCLHKPFRLVELLQVVRRTLQTTQA
jgi:PAS domain S-box-containing protein